MKQDCIFCKIVNKEAPAHVVYEDEHCVGFLPLKPVNPGHVLMAARTHHDSFIHLPDAVAVHLMAASRTMGKRIEDKIKPARVGFSIVGFEVSHVHVHVIPLHKKHEITSSAYAGLKNGVIEWSEENIPLRTAEQQEELKGLLEGV